MSIQLRTLMIPVLVALFALPARTAHAETTCTATVSGLPFGTVTGLENADTTGSVTVSCSTFGLSLLATAAVRMCLNIGTGASGNNQTNPRRMENGFGDGLEFQIYRNAGRTMIWGDSRTPSIPTPLETTLEYAVPLLGGSGNTGPIPIYGRVFAQDGLAAGTFSNVFSDAHTRIDYSFNEQLLLGAPMPPNCDSGPATGLGSITFPFSATANVPNQCDINSATDLDFGNVPGLINTPQDQTSSISLSCTGRTLWNVGLDNGQNASGSTRRMRLGTSDSYVDYELYRDPARTQRWGTTINTDTLPGTGTGNPQTVTVYGRVPAGQAVPAGSYRDTVTVTVTY